MEIICPRVDVLLSVFLYRLRGDVTSATLD